MPTPFEAGLGGFLGGFADTLANSLLYNQQQHQKELQRQKALAQKQQLEQQNQDKWNQTVQGDMGVLGSLLDPASKIPIPEARVKLSTLEQEHGTKLTPIFDTVMKQRQSQPYLGMDQTTGQPIPNPTYVPKYTNKVDTFPDVGRNLMIAKTADYDPLTQNYRKDAQGNVIYKEEKTLGKLFETNKSKTPGAGGKGISSALQQNLNKMAADYIKSQAAVTAVSGLPPAPDDYTGAKKQDAERAAIQKGETSRANLESWVDQVMPAADNAQSFLSGITKAAKGQAPDKDYFWKKVVENYKAKRLNDLDVQMLAYKYLTMYGTFPKGYIPAFKTSGAVTTPNEDNQDESDQEEQ